MKLCIVRHGSAVVGSLDDISRGLTEQGTNEAAAAGRWLAKQSWNDAEMWVSPYFRAQQTAANINAGFEQHGSPLAQSDQNTLTPSSDVQSILELLVHQQRDLILVSHLPLVGRLAAALTEGQVFDQPWSPAECWILEGEIAASGCMDVSAVWYPALEHQAQAGF